MSSQESTTWQALKGSLGAASAALQGLEERMEKERASYERAIELLRDCEGKIVIVGLGKSGIIARKIAATLASTGSAAVAINAADALHGDLGTIGQGDVVIMLSNSAATAELVEMLPILRRLEVAILGIFGSKDTLLAQSVDVLLHLPIEREGCPLGLAPMASTTSALALGDALAAALMVEKRFEPVDFAQRHPAGFLGKRLLLCARDVMIPVADVPVAALESGFAELIAALTQKNYGALCVVRACSGENERHAKSGHQSSLELLGIISDGDIRRTLLQEDPFALRAEQIMTKDPLLCAPEDSLDSVLQTMESGQRKVYVLPVVEGNCLVGLVRMHDILTA